MRNRCLKPFKCRDEIWADEETITLASLGISLFTWSAFQKMIKIEGEEAGQNLLQEFMEKYITLALLIIML